MEGTDTKRPEIQRVTVVDFDMKFSTMVGFMIKWAIAAIPALLLLSMLLSFAAVAFSGVIAGLLATVTGG